MPLDIERIFHHANIFDFASLLKEDLMIRLVDMRKLRYCSSFIRFVEKVTDVSLKLKNQQEDSSYL